MLQMLDVIIYGEVMVMFVVIVFGLLVQVMQFIKCIVGVDLNVVIGLSCFGFCVGYVS